MPAHRVKETVDLLSSETPAFILPTLWPPNSPHLTPVDYKVWSVLQEQVYKVKVNDVDELGTLNIFGVRKFCHYS